MEGKGVAAAAALCCMLVMLSVSGQQQVAGFTGFSGCFGSCYPACREGNPAWLCTIKCVESCTIDLHEVPVAAFGAGDCSKICLSSICGATDTGDGTTDAGAAAACVDDCTVNWKSYKNKHT
ncbi:hypothetical protein PVAP13_9NG570728 [Panicum virgatum]|uniref:Acidic protein n=1 Tax=Panicum virgatum TaxID=38727 RepID=A0A8T0MZ27_PANVG|nr:hypothetical protein PVAP13_9NG570728 [Panicum virgatum]